MFVKSACAAAVAATIALCMAVGARASVPGVGPLLAALHAAPGIRSGRLRSKGAPAPRYTIHNIGYPRGYGSSTPAGFNNTGQIFGLVNIPLSGGRGLTQDCRLWTGSSFERLPLPADGYCVATAINDANAASGEYEVVGGAYEKFSEGSRAFAVIAGPAGFKRTTIYYANSPSTMIGVNASETSVAEAEFSRDTLADYRGLLYFTTTGAGHALAPLQAPAAPNAPPIHNLLPTYEFACAFGGCAINGQNEVLGYDYLTLHNSEATFATYTVGESSSLRHLPILISLFYGNVGIAPVAFNDLGQVVYLDSSVNEPAVFAIRTGVQTILPVVPADCPNGTGVPLSMNDYGEVLGVVENCTTDAEYWTWDPLHGTQSLNAQLPSSAYTIYPLGINDRGQILVKLVDSANVDFWGTLDPVVSPARAAREKVRL